MSILPQSVIKQIAKEVELGNTCYIQRFTRKITIIDQLTQDQKLIVAQRETQAELDKKIDNYVKIEKLSDDVRQSVRKYVHRPEKPDGHGYRPGRRARRRKRITGKA